MRTMKKIVFLVFFALLSVIANAQGIYTKVTKYDKFDDVVFEKNIKTLITHTDNKIIIETKGEDPMVYYTIVSDHYGRKDSVINLVANVWGYETQCMVITDQIKAKLMIDVLDSTKGMPDSLVTSEKINELLMSASIKRIDQFPTMTFRTISKSQYYFRYETDMVWVKFEDGSRIIYTKD